MITVLAHDPGAVNYGFSVVAFRKDKDKIKYKIRVTGKLKDPANIQGTTSQEMGVVLNRYTRGISALIKDHGVTNSVAERFMARGHGGTLIESVNMMLGRLTGIPNQNPVLLSSATWKNRVNKFFDLKAFYKEVRVEPHEIDATFMAFYLAEKLWGVDILHRFTKPKELRRLKERIEECTTSPLKKPKRKKRKSKKKSKRSPARSRK